MRKKANSPGGWRARAAFTLGCVLPLILLGSLAEGYLRLFPPKDLHPFLGEESPLTGPYVPDEDFAASFRSWEAFRADNAERLDPYLPLGTAGDGRPLWAFFGNSFIQAPGMLADTARAAVPTHQIFNLGRNELLFVRLAQVKTLLANGLRPERIFIALMPVDMLSLGPQPLATVRITARGALTYQPRLPAYPVGWLIANSRLALMAWVRAGRQQGNPNFNKRTLYHGIEDPLRADLRHLFGSLARLTQAHEVPVTILLIPAYHQITQRASFGFQDTLAALLRGQGYDVFDPRGAFLHYPNPEALFLPDRHFNALGNQVLLTELLKHLHYEEKRPKAPAGQPVSFHPPSVARGTEP